MKKRSCRRTDQETAIHERAVKLRKMTDLQLCQFIDRERAQCIEDAYKKGYEDAEKSIGQKSCDVSGFIAYIRETKIPGIGAVTINKLLKAAAEHGYI